MDTPQVPAHKERELRYIFRPKTNKDIADDYKYYQGEFLEDECGFVSLQFNGIESKIYTPELATLLCGENITLIVQGAGESIRLNRLEQNYFAKEYVKAYQEGVKQFKKEFPLTNEISYGSHTEEYAKRLHRHYFHAECLGFEGGWYKLKNSYPRIITAQSIRDHGFYAGIISEADKVIIELNLIDRGFAKCIKQKQLTPIDLQVNKPTQIVYALYHYYLQETGYQEDFGKHPKGKIKAIEEIAQAETISAKNFQSKYNIIRANSNRIAFNQIENIKAVVLMLTNYPKAKALAEDELKAAELKQKW